MHLLIFVFAGLDVAGLSKYAVYPVLLLYFFPWGEALQHWRAAREQQGSQPQGAQ